MAEPLGPPGAHPQPATLVDVLRRRALASPEREAYVFLDDAGVPAARLSYGELDARARAIAARLQAHGLQGQRALLLYPPGLQFVAAFMGCLYAGVVAVPAYPPRTPQALPRLLAIARDARPAAVLTTGALLPRIEALGALDGLRTLATDGAGASGGPGAAGASGGPGAAGASGGGAEGWSAPALDGESVAFLQYTSGSTAAPKGVMVSHGNLLHNEETIRLAFAQTADSVVVGWLPLYHDMGLIGTVLQPLYVGARAILMSPLAFLQKPFLWLDVISRHRATTSGGPNFAYDLCVRKVSPADRAGLDLSSWEVAFNGAEPVRAETLDRFAAAFAPCGFRREAFFPCYGLAEATLFVSGGSKAAAPVLATVSAAELEQGRVALVPPDQPGGRRLVSSGPPRRQQLAVVDPETGRLCPEHQVGEIWIAGDSVARGYWRREEETAATFGARLAADPLAADPLAAGTGRPGGSEPPAGEPHTNGLRSGEPRSGETHTREAQTGEPHAGEPPVGEPPGRGRFLRTGDLGFVSGGELFIAGRSKDLIIIRGRNLYPQDLEAAAERSHPAARPGCGAAFAVEREGEERLIVVQELDRRRMGEAPAVADAIRRALAEEHEVQVQEVVLVRAGSIPKTSSGKIQRHACRAAYLAGSLDVVGAVGAVGAGGSPAAAAPAAGGVSGIPRVPGVPGIREDLLAAPPEERSALVTAYLRRLAAQVLAVERARLPADRPLISLGLDAPAAAELESAIAAGLGVRLPRATLLAGASLAELGRQLVQLLAAPADASTLAAAAAPAKEREGP
jgi:acyl-CoA synthetase (AMP-forming)/AMP-acid ligase II